MGRKTRVRLNSISVRRKDTMKMSVLTTQISRVERKERRRKVRLGCLSPLLKEPVPQLQRMVTLILGAIDAGAGLLETKDIPQLSISLRMSWEVVDLHPLRQV